MNTDLKVGDEVYINSGIEPKLTFVITEFQEIGNDLLACGKYGCTHVDLLRKLEPDDDYEQIRDELFIPYRPQQSTVNNLTDDEYEKYLRRSKTEEESLD